MVVVGTGCTAVQIVASIVDDVATVDAIVRSPHWIVPEKLWSTRYRPGRSGQCGTCRTSRIGSGSEPTGLPQNNLYMMPRIDPEWAATHLSVSPVNDLVMQTSLQYLEQTLPDRPDLREKLTPSIRPYAKRIVKDPGFLEALERDHVSLHRASPKHVHPGGVSLSSGEFVEADVIVLATGFKVEYASFIDITGRNGKKLADKWDHGQDPRAYLGIQVSGFPNLFVTAGPNAAPNHGAGHNITSEERVHYIVECLQYLVENDFSAMDVKPEALTVYNEKVDEALDQTVWAHPGEGVTGYYRNQQG
ncbi:possible monooxygenase, C-terminal (plasmid) [Rhodococcus jostii RHA1]|uniref:Possible monooxygenase, C-terminal n=1 Tax=Rhodococcus jostii (strain RHA1) TaxID=101510 RepID=Q0RXE4_RHOJR|nr:possible monooxygenase, C-terminal [Rhodococcus jostii RHA1]